MEYIVSQKTRDQLAALLAVPAVARGFELIEQDQDRCIQEHIELALIESPTFHEENRAAAFKKKFEELGLADVHIDRGGNVVGTLKGTGDGPTVLVEGHLDTVFPFGSVKGVEEKDGYLYAPGIGDDTRALAMLLSVIRGIQGAEVRHTGDIIFVGTTREEGMGSLGGMKDFLDDNHYFRQPNGQSTCPEPPTRPAWASSHSFDLLKINTPSCSEILGAQNCAPPHSRLCPPASSLRRAHLPPLQQQEEMWRARSSAVPPPCPWLQVLPR